MYREWRNRILTWNKNIVTSDYIGMCPLTNPHRESCSYHRYPRWQLIFYFLHHVRAWFGHFYFLDSFHTRCAWRRCSLKHREWLLAIVKFFSIVNFFSNIKKYEAKILISSLLSFIRKGEKKRKSRHTVAARVTRSLSRRLVVRWIVLVRNYRSDNKVRLGLPSDYAARNRDRPMDTRKGEGSYHVIAVSPDNIGAHYAE